MCRRYVQDSHTEILPAGAAFWRPFADWGGCNTSSPLDRSRYRTQAARFSRGKDGCVCPHRRAFDGSPRIFPSVSAVTPYWGETFSAPCMTAFEGGEGIATAGRGFAQHWHGSSSSKATGALLLISMRAESSFPNLFCQKMQNVLWNVAMMCWGLS